MTIPRPLHVPFEDVRVDRSGQRWRIEAKLHEGQPRVRLIGQSGLVTRVFHDDDAIAVAAAYLDAQRRPTEGHHDPALAVLRRILTMGFIPPAPDRPLVFVPGLGLATGGADA